MILAQALHGYREGHRLLATGGGDLARDERAVMDRLSDLSGYMTEGSDFDVYHTGYPCGRHYAFAATWYDHAGSRPGCVFTHTLLIPQAEIGNVGDLFALTALHRRPTSARDVEPYRGELAADVPLTPPPMLSPTEMRGLVVMMFASGLPLAPTKIWEATAPTLDVARAYWGLLEPHHRRAVTFCTWAFGLRRLGEQPFALLGAPPAARVALRGADATLRPLAGRLVHLGPPGGA